MPILWLLGVGMSGLTGDDAERRFALDILLARLADAERIIAAVKVQRWEVFKWVVTVNTGLATAELLLESAQVFLWVMAALVALMGAVLVMHYNRRATGARSSMYNVRKYLHEAYFDLPAVIGDFKIVKKSGGYDLPELLLFLMAMGTSVMLPVIASLS